MITVIQTSLFTTRQLHLDRQHHMKRTGSGRSLTAGVFPATAMSCNERRGGYTRQTSFAECVCVSVRVCVCVRGVGV